jgi:hypothetical protein
MITGSAIAKLIRRFLIAVVSLLYFIVMYVQVNASHHLKYIDSVQVSLPIHPYWTTNPLCDNCNDTKTHNGHEDTVQHPHNESSTLQRYDDNAESANDDSLQVRSVDGVDRDHMARDGAWIDNITEMLKCYRQNNLDDNENSYARIPTKETWYVPWY